MAWPITTATKTHLDASTDDPSQARAELAALVDKVNEIIGQMAQVAAANKIAVFDADGKLSGSTLRDDTRIPFGASSAFRGALVTNSATQSINNIAYTPLTFDSETYDTDSIHSTSSNTNRLTVPAGITKVKVSVGIGFASNATGFRGAQIIKNGTTVVADVVAGAVGSTSTRMQISTPVITVSTGDYLSVSAIQSSGGALNIEANPWFAMEIIE